MNIFLGLTGSVAAVLTPKIVKKLIESKYEASIIATEKSLYFWSESDINVPVWTEHNEWSGNIYYNNNPITHIELRDWADLLLIAPCTANTLAKIANGICDNLLLSTVRAWQRELPLVIAPAMNTHIWTHPASQEHIEKIKNIYQYNLHVIEPIAKNLTCGENGVGALAEVDNIVKTINFILNKMN